MLPADIQQVDPVARDKKRRTDAIDFAMQLSRTEKNWRGVYRTDHPDPAYSTQYRSVGTLNRPAPFRKFGIGWAGPLVAAFCCGEPVPLSEFIETN